MNETPPGYAYQSTNVGCVFKIIRVEDINIKNINSWEKPCLHHTRSDDNTLKHVCKLHYTLMLAVAWQWMIKN